MKQPISARLGFALLLAAGFAEAREWKSAKGAKALEAGFVSVQGSTLTLKHTGKPVAFPLTAFAADDQQFAKNAQYIADAAKKWGPQSFEFNHPAEGGWVCRLATKANPKTGPVLFTGESFFLVTQVASKHSKGDQLSQQQLFAAGGRTYHPLQGGTLPIRAFALEAEEATQVWSDIMAQSAGDAARQSPAVIEPEIDIILTRGMGIPVGKGGLIATDAALLEDAKSIVVHYDGTDHPATVVKIQEKLGVAIVSCGLVLEPARLGAKKPPTLGQSIFALSFELNSKKKAFASQPTLTRGIISRMDSSGNAFQHDAAVPTESVGGFIIGEKGDVLGLYFQNQVGRKGAAKPGSNSAPPLLGSSINTQGLSAFLAEVPGASALKASLGGNDMALIGKSLLTSTVLIVATHEVTKTPAIAAATPGPAGAPDGAAAPTGWSLSKSGTRHNAKCRYYKAGAPCQPTDGKVCKVCGG